MTIFALFLCVQAMNSCEMQGAARMTQAGMLPAMTFDSLAACETMAKRVSGLITPPDDHRFRIPNGMYYECRSRHVETWQRP